MSGVRPEDCVIADDDMLFTGKVHITEALGEVTLLYFEPVAGAHQVIAKLPGIHKDMRGQEVALIAPPPTRCICSRMVFRCCIAKRG